MKKLTSSIVIALLTLSSCVNKSAMQDPVRIPLYEMEEAGSKYYRIPRPMNAVMKDGSTTM